MTNIDELNRLLDKAAGIADPLDRRLFVLSIVTEHLAELGVTPILVGGAAVEFYTAGGYATRDVDVVMPSSPAIGEAMVRLGFSRSGRYWMRRELDVLIEAPGDELAGDLARVVEIDVEGRQVRVIGVEDLLIDRLNAFVHWRSEEDGRWASRLLALASDDIDMAYLRTRAHEEQVEAALDDLLAGLDAGE